MIFRDKFGIAAVLAVISITGCSGDDDGSVVDAGLDAGANPRTDGGGNSRAGSNAPSAGKGSAAAGKGATATAGKNGGEGDDDAGPGEPDAAVADGGAAGGGTAGGGTAGSPAGGASGAGAGGSGEEPAPGCPGLMECCAQLTGTDRTNCELLAANADDMTCDQLQPLYCQGSGADDACETLTACCDTLPRGPYRVSCAMTAMTGTPLQCEQIAQVFCPEGGDPNACTSLATCCESLPPPQRPGCTTIVEQGLAGSCQTVEMLLCP